MQDGERCHVKRPLTKRQGKRAVTDRPLAERPITGTTERPDWRGGEHKTATRKGRPRAMSDGRRHPWHSKTENDVTLRGRRRSARGRK